MTENPTRADELAQALTAVQQRVAQARAAADRRDDVLLVVVTKTFPASDVELLSSLGVTDVGENRDQEARAKRSECADGTALRWHMIGQVQRNKAGSVSHWADVVESVDRASLVSALARAATAADRTIEVLLQVNLDPDPVPGRGGALPEEIPGLAESVAAETGLVLGGVMGVAPHPGRLPVSESASRAFSRLAEVSTRLVRDHPDAVTISAGMSGDLEEAIAHGATQVRIGGAILGTRPVVE